jgi:putative transposase
MLRDELVIRLGICLEWRLVARLDQNGRHERMHGMLKAEVCKPPSASFAARRRGFDKLREEYDRIRSMTHSNSRRWLR